jgi:ABC-type sugar transport system permease subunit
VYLMTSQKGSGEGVDILVSDLYKQAFQYNRYSFSAAYSLVIFFLLTLLTLFWIKSTKVARDPLR